MGQRTHWAGLSPPDCLKCLFPLQKKPSSLCVPCTLEGVAQPCSWDKMDSTQRMNEFSVSLRYFMGFASYSGSYMFPKYPLYIKLPLFVGFSMVLIMKLSETFITMHSFLLCPCGEWPKPVVEGTKAATGMLKVSNNFSWFSERLPLLDKSGSDFPPKVRFPELVTICGELGVPELPRVTWKHCPSARIKFHCWERHSGPGAVKTAVPELTLHFPLFPAKRQNEEESERDVKTCEW